MEKRIELEKRGKPADEIYELNLDSCRATQIAGLTDEFKNLQILSLINAGLTTLKGFPNLPNLRKLDLSDNRISGGLNLLQGCPKLTYLSLSGNKIKEIETLEPLKKLHELRNLDLLNCEVSNLDGYREQVFELLDGLNYLDGFDPNNEEAEDEDEDGDDEINGDDDDDEEDEDGEDYDDEDEDEEDDDDDDNVVDLDDEDEEDEDEDGEVPLEYLTKDGLEEESEGEEFEPGDDDEDVEEEEEEDDIENEVEESRGMKRKHDDESNDA